MDVMKLKAFCVAMAALLAASAAAEAQEFKGALRYGAGLKEYVPAPIPVPAGMPVPEGFSYYVRADLGWSFSGDATFAESGGTFGASSLTYPALSDRSVATDDVFIGTVGAGVYLTPRFRGDLTLDFRSQQDVTASATYADPGPVDGVVAETLRVSRFVGLVNAYWDILPRGAFTPYIGAGIGLVYNDISRSHLTTEDSGGGPLAVRTAGGKSTNVGLAAALMAGASFSFSHQWALDVGYRALYLDGGTVTATLPVDAPNPAQSSRVTLDNMWEHQVRVGLRYNIW